MNLKKRNFIVALVFVMSIVTLSSCTTDISSIAQSAEDNSTSTSEVVSDQVSSLTSVEDSTSDNYIFVTSVEILSEDFSTSVGASKQLNSQVLPTDALYKSASWSSSDTSVATVDNSGKVTGTGVGSAVITCSSDEDSSISDSVEVTVTIGGGFAKTELNATVQDTNLDYSESLGDQKVLIIPIHLSSGPYSGSWTSSQLETVSETIFDTEDPESYVSYYKTASYGRLELTGEVSEVYNASYKTSDFDNERTAWTNMLDMFANATEWVDANDDTVDIEKDYDKNGDGYIDNIHFIVDGDDQDEWGSYIWPHMAQTGNYPGTTGGFPTVNTYSLSNLGHFEDAYTTIHEQGHIFGLMDYYDYTYADSYEKNYDLIGSADMQDCTMFDWNVYSKMNMGWVDPYYFDGSQESASITISPAATSGDCIVLASDWNGNAFDEYFTLELFTKTGNNEYTWDEYEDLYDINLGDGGIRMSHVDSRVKGYKGNSSTGTDVDNIADGEYDYYGLRNSNDYTSVLDSKLLQVIEADGKNEFGYLQQGYYNQKFLEEDDLFQTGDKFTMEDYSNFFVYGTKMNNGDEFPYEISFDMVSATSATITVTKK